MTDREGRLVATLGIKSNSKKINRKAILEVDVPKACRTIIDPVAPMALRLQGNLLCVISMRAPSLSRTLTRCQVWCVPSVSAASRICLVGCTEREFRYAHDAASCTKCGFGPGGWQS